MKKLGQMEGMRAQLAFEMLYGAKPSLRGKTITGNLVLVGYGHDKVDIGVNYINLFKKNLLSDSEIVHLEKVSQPGLYIKVSEENNDIDVPVGTMIFIDHGFDYLASSDWKHDNIINLIMNEYGRKVFEWYGQISKGPMGKVEKMHPYMAISVEKNPKDKEFFICEAAEFLIKECMNTQQEPATTPSE